MRGDLLFGFNPFQPVQPIKMLVIGIDLAYPFHLENTGVVGIDIIDLPLLVNGKGMDDIFFVVAIQVRGVEDLFHLRSDLAS